MGKVCSDAKLFRHQIIVPAKNGRVQQISQREIAERLTERLRRKNPNSTKVVNIRYLWRLESGRFVQVDKVVLEALAELYTELGIEDVSRIIYYDPE